MAGGPYYNPLTPCYPNLALKANFFRGVAHLVLADMQPSWQSRLRALGAEGVLVRAYCV